MNKIKEFVLLCLASPRTTAVGLVLILSGVGLLKASFWSNLETGLVAIVSGIGLLLARDESKIQDVLSNLKKPPIE